MPLTKGHPSRPHTNKPPTIWRARITPKKKIFFRTSICRQRNQPPIDENATQQQQQQQQGRVNGACGGGGLPLTFLPHGGSMSFGVWRIKRAGAIL
mmetsp:Transcript_54219/g.123560  ORF Transcript_54219/g.123560 Transcript_54219/m.123560 type:complete len:96 (+) Transcript_54219:1014-1301(+)